MDRINGQECLDDHIRYLLKHMNLSLCAEKRETVNHEMSARLSDLMDVSMDDFRLVLKLITDVSRDASARRSSSSSVNFTVIYESQQVSLVGN